MKVMVRPSELHKNLALCRINIESFVLIFYIHVTKCLNSDQLSLEKKIPELVVLLF